MDFTNFATRASLASDLTRLGVQSGDLVMVHTSVRQVGHVLGGPDDIIAALRDAVGSSGTLMAYVDCEAPWDWFLSFEGRLPESLRSHIPAFDPQHTRAARYVGTLPEFLRTTPGALRSANPGASVTALGPLASWLTDRHRLDYGYGQDTPLSRLVEAGGKVLMLGAPLDTMTLLHHAEHLAKLPNKRVKRFEVPFAVESDVIWRDIEEFETFTPVVEGLPGNSIEQTVAAYLADGNGQVGRVGCAESILVDAHDILPFAIEWLESYCWMTGRHPVTLTV